MIVRKATESRGAKTLQVGYLAKIGHKTIGTCRQCDPTESANFILIHEYLPQETRSIQIFREWGVKMCPILGIIRYMQIILYTLSVNSIGTSRLSDSLLFIRFIVVISDKSWQRNTASKLPVCSTNGKLILIKFENRRKSCRLASTIAIFSGVPEILIVAISDIITIVVNILFNHLQL